MLAVGVLFGAGSALAQQDTANLDLTGAPVHMHEGTCADPVLDPWDEIGRRQRQDYGDVGEEVDTDLTPEGFLSEDTDDDGVLDDGEDLNENGVLDTGVDADGDGTLTDDEIVAEGEAMVGIANRPNVYVANGEVDATFEAIFDQQNVIAVHESSEQYENIVACGNVGGIEYEDEEEVVIGLSAVDGSGVRGYAVFNFDPALFGNDVTVVDVFLFENLQTQRDIRAGTPGP